MEHKLKTEIVEKFLKDNKMSKSELAKECKISLSSLYKILKNNSHISLRVILKIAICMKVRLQDLFT